VAGIRGFRLRWGNLGVCRWMSCARVVIFGSCFWISLFIFFILEFHFLFIICSTRQKFSISFVIEGVSSNDDAFPTYIHA